MSVKLYRHNESGEVVAANKSGNEYMVFHGFKFGRGLMETLSTYSKERFKQEYTPLPEAPEVGSTAWAVWMMEQGCKVNHTGNKEHAFYFMDGDKLLNYYSGQMYQIPFRHDWKLYEATKPIVELLPHEFRQEQPVLARKKKSNEWVKCEFDGYLNPEKFNGYGMKNWGGVWPYCLPYTENAHLEGQITDGEHGAVPRGYVPPHVPQLGDSDYWCVGDEVVDLAELYRTRIITHVFENHIVTKHSEDSSLITYYTKNGCFIDASNMRDCGTLRVLYHDTSYVREDGTVHEHIPTRPHRIESCTTCDGTDDVESCAYCKDKG